MVGLPMMLPPSIVCYCLCDPGFYFFGTSSGMSKIEGAPAIRHLPDCLTDLFVVGS